MVEQGQDDPGSSGVGQCTTQAVHHVETRSTSQHALNYTARTEHSVTGVSPDRMPVRGSSNARDRRPIGSGHGGVRDACVHGFRDVAHSGDPCGWLCAHAESFGVGVVLGYGVPRSDRRIPARRLAGRARREAVALDDVLINRSSVRRADRSPVPQRTGSAFRSRSTRVANRISVQRRLLSIARTRTGGGSRPGQRVHPRASHSPYPPAPRSFPQTPSTTVATPRRHHPHIGMRNQQ